MQGFEAGFDYDLLLAQLSALCEDCTEPLPLLSNTAALLGQAMLDLNWVGFYFRKKDELLLGPFQGQVACMRIQWGRGVCGTAAATDTTQLVPDVHRFPGHIACDSRSQSEIVVPIHSGQQVIGVLDIDSPSLNRFSEADQAGLEGIVHLLESKLDWNSFLR